MKRFFGEIKGNIAIIKGEEFLHLKTVLRLREGDEIIVLDGSETEYTCRLFNIKKDYAEASVLEKHVCIALPNKNIVLFQGLTKREKLELIVQKAVELGVSKIVPFSSDYTIAKDSITKKDRLEKIVRGACKQCERSVLMEIESAVCFEEMIKQANNLDIVIFANERGGENFDFCMLEKFDNIGVIIGPEGGFSENEKNKLLKSKAKSVTLGKRILRSETAAIVLMGMISILSKN